MSSNRDVGVQLHVNGNYYQAVWYDSHGRRKRRGIGRRKECGGDVSERQAKRECSKIANELATSPGRRDQAGNVRLGEWCDRFDELRSELSAESRRLYRDAAKLMRERWGDDRKLDSITHLDAAEFASDLATDYPNVTTCRKHLRHCKGIFAHAKRLHLVAVNPFDGVATSPPKKDKDWQHVSIDDFEHLIDSTAKTEWRAILALCRLAGLRRGEALRLQWGDVDFTARTITIQNPGQVHTTKKRRRVVPIQPRLYDLLLERFSAAAPGETVTGLGENNLDREVRALIRRAGFDVWDKPFHTLRKSCESEWLADYPVMDVCEWLGHAPQVAAEHYHKTTEKTADLVTGRAAERMDELERAKAEIARLRKRCRRVIRAAKAKA